MNCVNATFPDMPRNCGSGIAAAPVNVALAIGATVGKGVGVAVGLGDGVDVCVEVGPLAGGGVDPPPPPPQATSAALQSAVNANAIRDVRVQTIILPA